jgi:3-methylcrotonyl-CoA carboxylase alpha subunit
VFKSVLIANRGEIACRVIRTARRMGLRTIAVYSSADAGAAHVAMADEAHEIGPPPARESYLDASRILAAAAASRAEAIHPGYGFLSENADFAAACAARGLIFIGPPAAAMRALGDKARAKALMEAAGVPVVPGYHGGDQAHARFAAEAQRIGFPVMVKASAGGGGRGMRVVERAGDLEAALSSAAREAAAAFGDGRLLLEKYLARPRHIEVQVFADQHGNAVHLFERDCSIQRRHQKIIEEAPAPGLDDGRRAAFGKHAVAAALSAGYAGAGTVEFLAEAGAFYFIEVNARLQVEHPVTEMITGQDLVEWQFRVAAGERLPMAQDQIAMRGHAVEARLYAEDPARDHLPQAGTVARLKFPAPDLDLRIETGVREGDAVGVYYDALLAKLIAWGDGRDAALARLHRALGEIRVLGLATNRDLLMRVLAHPEFAAGNIDTNFLARHREALKPGPASFAALAAAALALDAADAPDPADPWRAKDGWRLLGPEPLRFSFTDDAEHIVHLTRRADGVRMDTDGATALVRVASSDGHDLALEIDGRHVAASVLRGPRGVTVMLEDETRRFVLKDPLAPPEDEVGAGSRLTAPMPGKILSVHVAMGDRVTRGQLLMVLEAMKMEHAVTAPADGVVEAVHYRAGDLVKEGALLLAFAGA